MNPTRVRSVGLALVVLLLVSGMVACDIGGGASKPTITITAPTSDAQFEEGEEVSVLSSANDSKGVTRVELYVDGDLYRTDSAPSADGETSLAMIQTWVAADPGMHTLSVIAYNVDGTASDPWAVTIEVVAPGGVVTPPTPTTSGGPPPAATNTPPPPPEATNTPPPPEETAAPPTDTPEPTNTPEEEPGQPDLVLDGLSVVPSDPDWGGSLQVAVDVSNMGSADSGPYSVLFRWGSGDFDVCEWNQSSLPPMNGGTLRCTVDNIYVSYTTEATVDWRDAVDESNEDNNSMTRRVEVGPAGPDLEPEGMNISPRDPDWGDPIQVTVGVRNIGSQPSGPYKVLVRWGSGDFDVCEWNQPSLPAGDAVTLDCTVEHIYVSYNAELTIDWRDEVDESNEDNNSMTVRVEVGPRP
jgi:hypothetical protein